MEVGRRPGQELASERSKNVRTCTQPRTKETRPAESKQEGDMPAYGSGSDETGMKPGETGQIETLLILYMLLEARLPRSAY